MGATMRQSMRGCLLTTSSRSRLATYLAAATASRQQMRYCKHVLQQQMLRCAALAANERMVAATRTVAGAFHERCADCRRRCCYRCNYYYCCCCCS